MPFSIAVAQTCPLPGDVAANTTEHVRLAEAAADAGAGLLLFPELSLTGYEIALAPALAFTEDDPRLDQLRALASRLSMVLVVGAPLRSGVRLHIAACVLMPDGSLDVYTKRRLGAFSEAARCDGTLPPAEATVFAAGYRDPLVQAAGSVAAIAVCADVSDLGRWQRAARRGAGIYLASMFVIPSDFDGETAKLREGAAANGLVVALANFGAASGGLATAGRSAFYDEHGEQLIQLKPGGSGVALLHDRPEGRSVRAIEPA